MWHHDLRMSVAIAEEKRRRHTQVRGLSSKGTLVNIHISRRARHGLGMVLTSLGRKLLGGDGLAVLEGSPDGSQPN